MQRQLLLNGRSGTFRYGAAVASIAVALVSVKVLGPNPHDFLTFLLLVAVVAVTAWLGGVGPAMVSTVAGFLGATWLTATSSYVLPANRALLDSLAYFLGTLPIVFFTRMAQRIREQASAKQRELEREIAERERAEESLRDANITLEQLTGELRSALDSQERQKQRFENILDHLPVGVVLLTLDREVAFANQLFRKRFGEPTGRRCFNYIHHRNLPCESCHGFEALQNVALPSRVFSCEDGTVTEVFSFSFADPDGTRGVLEVGVDITESRRTQERLSEQASLLQLAHDAIVVTDLNGVIKFWNHAAEQMYGWRENEVIGSNLEELLSTAGPLPLHEIRAITRDLGQWEGELTHLRRGGVPVIVESRWSLQRDPDGKPSAILDINRDITKRRLAEEELRRSRESLTLAMEAGHCAAFEWDLQNGTSTWSQEMEELYGVVPGTFDGRHESWEALILSEDLPRVRADIQESLVSGECQSEWRIRRRCDGEVRWLAARAKWLFDSEGRPLRMRGVNMDITDRKRVEVAQRESEERYRALVWATSQVVWTAGPDGNRADSPSWRALTGQTEDQAVGSGWLDAIHPDDLENTTGIWHEAVRNCSAFEQEYRIRRHDGEFRELSVRGVPVPHADGSVREWVGACTDITDRKRAERALALKSEELVRSNAELQRFAYVASHDLQEPLRLVANFTQLLAERYGAQLDDSAREFMAYAVDGATRMRAMIQDLLAYSRVDVAAQVTQPVDCNESLGRAVWNLRSLIEETFALVTHDELPSVQGHPSQVVQLFQNLIGNAIKFNRGNPPRVHVSAVHEGTNWNFSVADNGIGIEPQYYERVFVIFQRLHRVEEYPGTGIGLALCKKIVERHGGRIWVESRPGEGSIFFFTLPESIPVSREEAPRE